MTKIEREAIILFIKNLCRTRHYYVSQYNEYTTEEVLPSNWEEKLRKFLEADN